MSQQPSARPFVSGSAVIFFFFLGGLPACSGGGGGGSSTLELLDARFESGAKLPTEEAFLNDRLLLVFSAPLNPTSVTLDSVQIRREQGGFTIQPPGELIVRDREISFTPALPTQLDFSDAGWQRGEGYRVRIRGNGPGLSVRSRGGRELPRDREFLFRARATEPFLRDVVGGPPRIVGVAFDLDQDGFLATDGDGSTLDEEEILRESDGLPVVLSVPVGLAMRPSRFGILLSEPILPASVLRDLNLDTFVDSLLLVDQDQARSLAFDVELVQGFNVESNRYFSMISVIPRTTLPRGALLEARVLSGIVDLASPGLSLPVETILFETDVDSRLRQDALIEDFHQRTRLDPSSTAEWDILNSDVLRAGNGIGGTGIDGPFRVPPNRTVFIDTNINGGIRQFTEVLVEAGARVEVSGLNPLRIFSTGDVELRGEILAEGGRGEDGLSATGGRVIQGGDPGPGGGRGGRANFPLAPLVGEVGRSPLGTDGGGQGGIRSDQVSGGGGGGGHASFGGNDLALASSGLGGKPYGDNEISMLLGGSGGGAGGNGIGGLPEADDTGGGGGGGGGAVSVSTARTFLLSGGRISVNGGPGGDAAPSGSGRSPGGGGGGGGSGGSIRVEALFSAEIVRGSLNHFGADGGNGGLRGGRPGARGADGRLRLYVLSGNREGSGAGKSFAMSRFLDVGTDHAMFSFDASNPETGEVVLGGGVKDLQVPEGLPQNSVMRVLFQGARVLSTDPRLPDFETVTAWTSRIDDLDGYRFIRWRLEFDIGLDIETARRPVVREIAVRFSYF